MVGQLISVAGVSVEVLYRDSPSTRFSRPGNRDHYRARLAVVRDQAAAMKRNSGLRSHRAGRIQARRPGSRLGVGVQHLDQVIQTDHEERTRGAG